MTEKLQTGKQRARANGVVAASQVARDTEVRSSINGVRFATFGETGLADLDLDRMLEAVPTSITASLKANIYYFVPLALREESTELDAAPKASEPALVATTYTDELGDAAICHRNVDLPHGTRGVFISTRLMSDRFALSFEFFINIAHAFVDQAGIPQSFADLVWKQALDNVRGETSLDAWESRNLAFGRPANAEPDSTTPPTSRRARAPYNPSQRSFATLPALSASSAIDDKERALYLDSAFSDAVAIYLLSLALDFDYSELREREYPLLAPTALAARLRLIATLHPPNPLYEFAVKYRRRA